MEIIVILAILAALLIPAMTRWIDKAREKSAIVGCRTCVVAAQTLASGEYALAGAGNVVVMPDAVLALAKVDGAVGGIDLTAPATLAHLTYTDPNGIVVKYCRSAGGDGCGVYNYRAPYDHRF